MKQVKMKVTMDAEKNGAICFWRLREKLELKDVDGEKQFDSLSIQPPLAIVEHTCKPYKWIKKGLGLKRGDCKIVTMTEECE